jgi:O-antigen/teichoic acid export membrane protein
MTPVLIAGLGLEAFGIWVVVTSLAVFRDLLQFGFLTATPKYVAESSALDDRAGMRAAIATSFWILAALGGVTLVLGLGVAALFPELFGVSGDLRTPAQVLALLMTIDFALSMPCSAFAGTLMGLQRFDLLNTTQVVIAFAQAAAWAIVLVLDGGLVALGAVTLAIGALGQLWRYLIARRLAPELSVAPRSFDRSLVKPFTRLSAWYGLEDAAYLVVTRVDAIVVGLVLGVSPAGIYGVGQKLALALGQLVQPVSGLFFPHASELAAERDTAGLRSSVVTGTRLLFAIAAPLALTLSVLAEPIIEAWVGSGFDEAATVTVFLSTAIAVWVLADTGLTMLLGMGRARVPAIIRAAEAGVNLCLSVALAHLIGLEGVALATLLAAILANLIVLFPYICAQFGLRVRDLAGPLIASHAPAAAAGLAVGWLVSQTDPTGVLALIAGAVAITGAYACVFAITGLDESERHALLARLRLRPSLPPA